MIDRVLCFAPQLAEQSDGYDPSRYQTIATFQTSYFWFRGRNELIASQLKKYFPAARRLLEIGCGTGQVLRAIKEAVPKIDLHGTEIHTHGICYAKDLLPDVNFMQVDARAIPYAEEFDVICAFDVIEHIDDDIGVLKEMYRSCRADGGIILTVPQHRWLWSHKDEMACHKRRYTREELETKTSAAGFKIVAATSFVTILLPLMYFSRLRRQRIAEKDAHTEFHISPIMNRIFFACSRIENFFIRMGLGLPFGGSLMLIGMKEKSRD